MSENSSTAENDHTSELVCAGGLIGDTTVSDSPNTTLPEGRQGNKFVRLLNFFSPAPNPARQEGPPPDVANINRHIDLQRQNLARHPPGSRNRAKWLTSFGISFQRRFEYFGKRGDLNQANYYLRAAIDGTSETNARKHMLLECLAICLFCQFCSTRQGEDSVHIDEAIKYQRHALNLVPDGHMNQSKYAYTLGTLLLHRYQRSNEIWCLEESISFLNRAVEVPQAQAEWLHCLSGAHVQRLHRLSELQDLDRAIFYLELANGRTSDERPEKLQRLNGLSALLYTRFEHSKNRIDFDNATSYQTKALHLAKSEYTERTSWLSSLGTSHLSRFEVMGDLDDLERAIAYQEQAVTLTPEGHPDKPTHLFNLGNSLQKRFERLGELVDIDRSITCLNEAHNSISKEKANIYTKCIEALGSSLSYRYQRLLEIIDLEQAIIHHSEAAALTHADSPAKPRRLESLGSSFLQRYERDPQPEDLECAIELYSEAVKLTPESYAGKARRLDCLGTSLRHRFQRTLQVQDIDNSIEYHAKAVGATPPQHADLSRRLDNLGLAYMQRFELRGDFTDINLAINHHTRSSDLTPDDHVDKSRRLYHLSCALTCRFEANLGEISDIKSAISAVKAAALSPTGSPSLRFTCARKWAKLCSYDTSASPLDAYGEALKLLPRIIWLGAELRNRYSGVRLAGDIATEATAAAIASNAYDLALEWLEEGTSILWKQLLQLRTPLDDLRKKSAQLAAELESVAKELDLTGDANPRGESPPCSMVELEKTSQKRRRLAERWDHLIASARQLPGLQNFLKPRTALELTQGAHSSAVVVINVHASRCDALIIRPHESDVFHLPLYSFSQGMANELHTSIKSQLHTSQSARLAHFPTARGVRFRYRSLDEPQEVLKNILAALWKHVVNPVLECLGYKETRDLDKLPRITWRTTGSLAFLPLHGAGDYRTHDMRVYNYAMSSYTPSLAALLVEPPTKHEFAGIALVEQSLYTAPGFNPLPGVTTEIQSVLLHCGDWPVTRLQGPSGTCDAVLKSMEEHSWVHFACHSSQNYAEPMTSSFYLPDRPLDIKTIVRKSIGRKGLAYLSACSSAEGDKELPEESIHLASGMLVAGYSTVIATMWSIADGDAPIVADKVYAHLLGAGQQEHKETAKALHLAITTLRSKVGETEFWRWLPFVHVGL
ncbi:hypothetical protein FRC07_009065 [Ceratobasidium sp. 392]|nr:hypothetical protein FRC07_009065 [Ceratobasidium sp. 392]